MVFVQDVGVEADDGFKGGDGDLIPGVDDVPSSPVGPGGSVFGLGDSVFGLDSGNPIKARKIHVVGDAEYKGVVKEDVSDSQSGKAPEAKPVSSSLGGGKSPTFTLVHFAIFKSGKTFNLEANKSNAIPKGNATPNDQRERINSLAI